MGKRGNGEGSIYQRKDGRWAGAITLDNGRRKTHYGQTRQEVSRKLNTAVRAKAEGMPIPGELLTVEQLLESWLQERASKRVRPSTFSVVRGEVPSSHYPRNRQSANIETHSTALGTHAK